MTLKTDSFRNVEFESSCGKTEQFKSFVRAFRSDVKRLLKGFDIQISVGHFYVSGFVSQGDKHVYFSVSDVRHFSDDWYNHVLVRTAKDTKDYHGGSNNYTTLPQLRQAVENLMERGF
jgi:hypothetical protein